MGGQNHNKRYCAHLQLHVLVCVFIVWMLSLVVDVVSVQFSNMFFHCLLFCCMNLNSEKSSSKEIYFTIIFSWHLIQPILYILMSAFFCCAPVWFCKRVLIYFLNSSPLVATRCMMNQCLWTNAQSMQILFFTFFCSNLI